MGNNNWNVSSVTHNLTTSTSPSAFDGPVITSVEFTVVVSVVLGLIILFTIIGNAFVIAAIVLETNLHKVSNLLILSLAVADLMVASIVMPISAVNEVSKVWFLGSAVCVLWTTMDVLCCTASILHLVAIAIDRYWAVTNIDYILNRTPKRILVMIAIVWLVAMLITIPPLFGWRDGHDPTVTGVCIISQDPGYQVFATTASFYLPTLFMLIAYAKIYFVARSIIRKRRSAHAAKKTSNVNRNSANIVIATTRLSAAYSTTVLDSNVSVSRELDSADTIDEYPIDHTYVTKRRDKLEIRRERKAARTLAIITGVYIVCWLPFFIIALLNPFLRPDAIPALIFSIAIWLGYANSLLNPIIYTVFSPDFRAAFQKILIGKYACNCCRHNT